MPKIFVIAGEASGDHLAAELMLTLKQRHPNIEFRGIGGAEMLRAGLTDSLFPMEELSLMGIVEVVPKIPKIRARINQTVTAIKVYNPDIVLTVDSPDFCFRVQNQLKDENIKAKLLHFVAPTVWAWRPERARKIARFLDGLICLFPFEPDYFRSQGIRTIAIGHPVMKGPALQANGSLFRQAHGISQDQKVCGMFFGSRKSELDRMSGILTGVARSLQSEIENLKFVVPTLPRWQERLTQLLAKEKIDAVVTSGLEEKFDAMAACDGALVVSGTVALEVAVVGIPHALMYQMNAVTWQIVKRMVVTQNAHLVNIMLRSSHIPEFIQEDSSVDKILPTMKRILLDPVEQARQKDVFTQARAMLRGDTTREASDLAASFVEEFLPSRGQNVA